MVLVSDKRWYSKFMNTLDPNRPIVKAALVALRGEGDQKEMLLALAEGKDYWVLPGGKQDPGETIEATLHREIGEELSYTDADGETIAMKVGSVAYLGAVVGKTPPDKQGKTRDITEHLFLGDLAGEPEPQGEILELRWFGRTAITKMGDAITPLTRDGILPFLEKKGLW